MTQDAQSVTQEQDMSWFDIAIDNRGIAVILDYAPGWKDHGIEFYWEDTFDSDPPKHLAVGAYRWTGFKVGFWGEDEHLNVTGGEFIPHRLASQPTSAEDAERWMYFHPAAGENIVRVRRPLTDEQKAVGWTETPLYTRPTPDTQTAAIGAEAMRDALDMCRAIIKYHVKPDKCCSIDDKLFSALEAHEAAVKALSQPVAAPQQPQSEEEKP